MGSMTTTPFNKAPVGGPRYPDTPIPLIELTNSTSEAQMASEELRPSDVAREFKVSPTTVRRWGKRGWLTPTRTLPGSKYRRYSREDVEAFRKRLEAGEFDASPTEPGADAAVDGEAKK